ncbi:MAG: type polyketide synthase [Hyphomicrobiales bacterium]|nr:type polyketide synthase [Hyphomicrobiales bacterium]
MNTHFVSPPRLLGLGTAVPPHELPQDMVKQVASRILGARYPEFERLSKSFENSGIDRRYSVVPFEWFEQAKDWPARTKAYLEGATSLFIAAARQALDASGLRPDEIDTIVTVSSTGIATPTLEARAMQQMGFRSDVRRVPVFGLGCAGGVTGLSLAARLAAVAPGSKVLLVCVEACTLAFRADRLQKADIIATVLFGDGAAAACISTDGRQGAILGEGQEHTWPDTLPIMGWEVDADGFGVVFDRSIPAFVKDNFAAAVETALERMGLDLGSLRRMICHPGGAKVVDAIESALHLEQGVLDHERSVLRDYGNMSAPTALFVLQRVAESGLKGNMMLAALGPGFTASMLPIRFE